MEKEQYEKAAKCVQEVKGFYIHLMVYIIVNIGLVCINLITSSETIWFIYPLFGWGIGVGVHGLAIFVKSILLGDEWEKRKIEKYLNK